MKIGVDLRVLQIGHQYRGIGEVTKQCLNRIFELSLVDEENSPMFIFYEYEPSEHDDSDPKRLLSIPNGLKYSEVLLGKRPAAHPERSIIDKLNDKYRKLYGDPLPQAKNCDVFLQFDYALGVPKQTKAVLIAHDIIPFIFWDDYFTSPWLHVKHKAARTTLRTIVHNYESKRVLARSHRDAAKILCVSESTQNDLARYLHILKKKMKVVHLGVSKKAANTTSKTVPESSKLPTKPFILFVGGVDARRRRVDDVIAAFNNLKAAGHDIQLVLVGENFPSFEGIPNETVRNAAKESSYNKDILPVGYVSDETKQKLFKEAVAFVFPTTYEGFGIPVLEAMLQGCPVVTYKNSSIPEVGGKYALYANNWWDIKLQVEKILHFDQKQRSEFTAKAEKHAQRFTWEATGNNIYRTLLER